MSIELSRVDLNLVRVFIAVYQSASVTLAAQRLFVTQPSISYALGRLRELFGDQLFVRGPEGMSPTALAREIYGNFSQGLALIGDGLDQVRSFDEATADRLFKLWMSDLGELAFLPPLVEALERRAPGIRLEVLNAPTHEVPALLGSGHVDVAIGNLPTMAGMKTATVFSEHYVCLMRAGHPLTRSRKLNLDGYLAARHVYVPATSSGHHVVEEELQARGLHRRIFLRVPHFTALPSVLAGSDLVITMPSRAAGILQRYERLETRPLPVDIPQLQVRMFWNAQRERSVALTWLRQTIERTLVEARFRS